MPSRRLRQLSLGFASLSLCACNGSGIPFLQPPPIGYRIKVTLNHVQPVGTAPALPYVFQGKVNTPGFANFNDTVGSHTGFVDVRKSIGTFVEFDVNDPTLAQKLLSSADFGVYSSVDLGVYSSNTSWYSYPYGSVPDAGLQVKQRVTVTEPVVGIPPLADRTVEFTYTITRTPIFE